MKIITCSLPATVLLAAMLYQTLSAQDTLYPVINGNAVAAQMQKTIQGVDAPADLINERLSFMKDVAAYKWINHLPIEDLAREQVVLQNSAASAGAIGLDSLSSRNFFEQQILTAKLVQQYWFDQWKRKGFQNYAYRDLKAIVRPALTDLGDRISEAIGVLAPWELTASDLRKGKPVFLHQLTVKGLSRRNKIRLYYSMMRIKRVGIVGGG